MRFPFNWGVLYRYDPAVGAQREKTIPAGPAAVSRKPKQSENPREGTGTVLAGNALQVHVAAHGAMNESDVGDRRGPRVESVVAIAAAPRTEQSHSDHVIFYAPPAGSAGAVTLTDRAKQGFTPLEKADQRIREG
jgi:hypothetical protein